MLSRRSILSLFAAAPVAAPVVVAGLAEAPSQGLISEARQRAFAYSGLSRTLSRLVTEETRVMNLAGAHESEVVVEMLPDGSSTIGFDAKVDVR